MVERVELGRGRRLKRQASVGRGRGVVVDVSSGQRKAKSVGGVIVGAGQWT